MTPHVTEITLLNGSTIKNVRQCPLWWKNIDMVGTHELSPVVEGFGPDSRTQIACKCGVRGPWSKDAIQARDLWNDLPR